MSLTRKFVHSLHFSGSPVSSSIVITAEWGIVICQDHSFPKEYGGPVELKKVVGILISLVSWLVKRNGSCRARKLPIEFKEVKTAIPGRVADIMKPTISLSPCLSILTK